jgi:hypothetical protein
MKTPAPEHESQLKSVELTYEEAVQTWNRYGSALHGLKAETGYIRKHDRAGESLKARLASRAYEDALFEQHANSPSLKWSPNRGLDRQNFAYLFLHRRNFSPHIQELLEIVASKLLHTHADGSPAYFNKLERNIGWSDFITLIIFSGAGIAEKLTKCGMWSHAKNSHRCHKPDFCPLCLWNDYLKVQCRAFGRNSGAFNRAPVWLFITCGYTTNQQTAKAIGKDFDEAEFHYAPSSTTYEAYPVCLGRADDDPDLPEYAYDDARILGLIAQDALDELYQQSILDGYRGRLEGAFQLNPQGANRVNLHNHAVGNGLEDNTQFIADILFAFMKADLNEWKPDLTRDYYPDVRVSRLTTPEHLENCVIYSEKVIPVAKIVAEAMANSEAKEPDGQWNVEYVSALETSLQRLIDDDVPNIFGALRLAGQAHRLFRRKTIGNMVFTDRGTCIGDEPDWHKKSRRKKAAALRKKRAEKKLLGIPKKKTKKKANQRRRKNPRRLARSLGQPDALKTVPRPSHAVSTLKI